MNCPYDSVYFNLYINNETFRNYNYNNICLLVNIYNHILNIESRSLDEVFTNFMRKVSIKTIFEIFINFERLFFEYCKIRFPFIENIFCSNVKNPIDPSLPIFTILRNNQITVIYCKELLEKLINTVVVYNFMYNNLKVDIIDATTASAASCGGVGQNQLPEIHENIKLYNLFKSIDSATYKLNPDRGQNLELVLKNQKKNNFFGPNNFYNQHKHVNLEPVDVLNCFPSINDTIQSRTLPTCPSTSNGGRVQQTNIEHIFTEENYHKILYLNIINEILEKSIGDILKVVSESKAKTHKIKIKFNEKQDLKPESDRKSTKLSFVHPQPNVAKDAPISTQ